LKQGVTEDDQALNAIKNKTGCQLFFELVFTDSINGFPPLNHVISIGGVGTDV
jgi:hypothetical protein